MDDDPEMTRFLERQHEAARHRRVQRTIAFVSLVTFIMVALIVGLFGKELFRSAWMAGLIPLALIIWGVKLYVSTSDGPEHPDL